MKEKCLSFLRREPVLTAAVLAAAVSCVAVPPDRAYGNYIDFRTLALLYSLMVVVAGVRRAGAFDRLALWLCAGAGNCRRLGLSLTLLCFFSAMLITNDVALLTFVPFTLLLLPGRAFARELRYLVVLETVAANLGSMLTPVGNPQNLYLYAYYGLSLGEFLRAVGPLCAVSLLGLGLAAQALPRRPLTPPEKGAQQLDRRGLGVCGGLFVLCLLVVLRVLSWPPVLAVVLLSLLLLDRKLLGQADFLLLLTFVAFFVFVGNVGRMETLRASLSRLLQGRELAVSLLASQCISNVPAAVLLSGFTDNARALLQGVNIGGLGTPIASLASLISMKLYARSPGADSGRYLAVFTVVNVLGLLLLIPTVWWLG